MLGSAQSQLGRITRGYVDLAEFADGPFRTPVMLATGTGGDGPTLFVQAGVHGPEVIGQLAIARFLKGLDLGQLKGRIAALLVANPHGFRAQNRITPQDGANLNRVFPGKPDGSVSEQLAHRVLELSLAVGDALLDLHNGGDLTITASTSSTPRATAPPRTKPGASPPLPARLTNGAPTNPGWTARSSATSRGTASPA